MPNCAEPFIRLLSDPSENIRLRGLIGLSRLNVSVNRIEVQRLIDDPDAEVRARAARLLWVWGDHNAADTLFSRTSPVDHRIGFNILMDASYEENRFFHYQDLATSDLRPDRRLEAVQLINHQVDVMQPEDARRLSPNRASSVFMILLGSSDPSLRNKPVLQMLARQVH